MLSKLLIPSFLSSAPTKKQDKKTCPWAKVFLQHVKTYKKTGIKLREAMLINPDGTVVARDGDVQGLSDIDIMTIKNILVNGDECRDVLHLDSFYFCVKILTDSTMVLFNGAYYIIACLTQSKHLVIVDIRAKKTDGAKSIAWIQCMADQLSEGADPQGVGAELRDKRIRDNLLDWF